MPKFYHISETLLKDRLVPSIPAEKYEEQMTPRIRFAPSIEGCLRSVCDDKDITGQVFHVYSLETDDYYTPTSAEVGDVELTGEIWYLKPCMPKYETSITIIELAGYEQKFFNDDYYSVPIWKYSEFDSSNGLLKEGYIVEDNRTTLINKSRSVGNYKDQSKGKNRFERKKYSRIANAVKKYNAIDMNKLFKEDMLIIEIPIIGETDQYTVTIKMEGVIAEIARGIKNNQNKLEYKVIIQALTKIFNTKDLYVKCTCPDHLYNYAHWNIINNVSVDDTSHDPGPGKNIRNPNDSKGRGCKHILLVLANGDWMMKVASVINNYCHYAEEHIEKGFRKLIFPKLYGISIEDAIEEGNLLDSEEGEIFLDSTKGLIDAINEYGRTRGHFKKGSNKNPVTGTGPHDKKDTKNDKDTEDEEKAD